MGQIKLNDLSIMILHPNEITENSIYKNIENVAIGRGIQMPLIYSIQSKKEALETLNNNRNNLWGIIIEINKNKEKTPQRTIKFMNQVDRLGIPIPIVGYSTMSFDCGKPFKRKIQILPKVQKPSLELVSNSLDYFTQYHILIQSLKQPSLNPRDIKAA